MLVKGLAVLTWVAALLSFSEPFVAAHRRNFTYDRHNFLLDGAPMKLIGGQMDPQRIPPQYWTQRLQMAKAMGLNTIFSYIFWNNLEPRPGEWDFGGRNNISRFMRLAQQEGLYVVLRPGPYICGEHEWGGFPAWLSQVPGMAVRQNNKPFLDATRAYLEQLGKHLANSHISKGGPILMTQLENEYGSFGKDKAYLQATADILKANFDGFLYTNDGGGKGYLDGGTLHGVLAETDGSPKTGFESRDKFVTDPTMLGPQLDGEYYVTWIDHWSSKSTHQYTSGKPAATKGVLNDLDWILAGNNSFSIYMFHGGTNWGFENGGLWADNQLNAVTSSYDYGAPLDEAGRPTQIYRQIREMISKHVPAGTIPNIPNLPNMTTVGDFRLQPALALWDIRGDKPAAQTTNPATMESLGQAYGFVLYEHKVAKAVSGVLAPGDGPRDRVIVYVNGAKVGVIDKTYAKPATVKVNLKQGDLLQLFVENLGRIDYSQLLKEQLKGIVGQVKVGANTVLEGWSTYSIPLSSLPSTLNDKTKAPEIRDGRTPVFYKGTLNTPKGTSNDLSGDTFLALPNGIKGNVWVNGNHLGRYWTVGPQQSLYVPGAYLHGGNRPNDVVVLELEPKANTDMIGRGLATRVWSNNPDPDAP
ncbi:hypothetical protein QQS21_002586 [Conoideocrella luteorostrata]|uniref:Beta-galactosidase n=1 Tax=Conoideocrella luteorostrata TaxID=1105319 RepID=A0AAJ0CVV3_9HYPO|nr:hypothetical protein QQS21_002586 [Conoideocrella luteorostrata]